MRLVRIRPEIQLLDSDSDSLYPECSRLRVLAFESCHRATPYFDQDERKYIHYASAAIILFNLYIGLKIVIDDVG